MVQWVDALGDGDGGGGGDKGEMVGGIGQLCNAIDGQIASTMGRLTGHEMAS